MNGEDSKQEWRRISSAFMCAEYFACMLFFGNVWIKMRIWNSLRSKKYHKQTNAKRSESEWLRMLGYFACYWWFPSVSAPFTATHTQSERESEKRTHFARCVFQIKPDRNRWVFHAVVYCNLLLFVAVCAK